MNIAFFAFETRDLNTFPSIVNAMRLLARQGHRVDVHIPASMATNLVVSNCRILVVSEFNQYQYVKNSIRCIENGKVSYDLFFAFYIEDLFVCEVINRRRMVKVPVIYFSMELIYNDYPSLLLKRCTKPLNLLLTLLGAFSRLVSPVHSLSGAAWRTCEYWLDNLRYSMIALKSWMSLEKRGREFLRLSLVSDEMRARILKDEFSFVDRIAFVPAAGYIGYNDKPSRYAQERFNIPSHKKILLYTGGVERGFDRGLFEAAKSFGDDYILFCNVYCRDGYVEEVIADYAGEVKTGKIYFQLGNLNEEDYDQLVRSCYVGIAWYRGDIENDPNMYYMGLSSGKLNKFLSCGKPVLTRSCFFGYRDMIEGNGLGRVCGHAAEIPAQVTQIAMAYDAMRENIKSFYLAHLEFERCFAPVLDDITQITSHDNR
jgi:hypothetical protein